MPRNSNWLENMSAPPPSAKQKGDSSFESFTLISTTDDTSGLGEGKGGGEGEGGGSGGYFMDKLKAGKDWFQGKHAGERKNSH